MKLNEKIASIAASILLLGSAATAQNITFSNELSSNVVDVWSWKVDSDEFESKGKFAGLANETTADYEGKLLKVGVDVEFDVDYIDEDDADDEDSKHLDSYWANVDDFYIEFSPWKIIALGLSDELYTDGSYLPVFDDNVSGGNYSTNGFSVLIRPMEGLTIGAGLDFDHTSQIGDTDKYCSGLSAGADYSADKFSLGGTLRHMTSDGDRQIAFYGSIKAVDKLLLNLGITHSENGDAGLGDVDFAPDYATTITENGTEIEYTLVNEGYSGVFGEDIFTAGVTYDFSKFTLAGDLAYSFDDADSYYDLYAAADFGMDLTKALSLDVKGIALLDLNGDTDGDATLGIKPSVSYTTGKHTFSAGLKLQSWLDSDVGYTYFSLPVSWKYAF